MAGTTAALTSGTNGSFLTYVMKKPKEESRAVVTALIAFKHEVGREMRVAVSVTLTGGTAHIRSRRRAVAIANPRTTI